VLASGNVSAGDEELVTVEDDPDEVVRIIQRAHAQRNGGDPGLARTAEPETGPVAGPLAGD
jgi:hypothetical protein